MRRRTRFLRIRPLPTEDDGMVVIRGHLVTPEWAEWNARYHLEGFDELPRSLRDKINYAETVETGAFPPSVLIGPGGPFDRAKAEAEARAEALYRIQKSLTTNRRQG